MSDDFINPLTGQSFAPEINAFNSSLPPDVQASPSNPLLAGLNSGSRGMKNNNPGNLVASPWTAGLAGYSGSDGRFAEFKTPEQGLAALDQNLQSYGGKGINTPLAIASTWAPAATSGPDSMNRPNAYGAAIAKELGVKSDTVLDMNDVDVRNKISRAIVQVENGTSGGGGASPATGGSASQSATAVAAPSPAGGGPFNPKGLYTLSLLQSLFPQHKFTPIDYDPFKVMPHVEGVGN